MADLPRNGRLSDRADRSDGGSALKSIGSWLRTLLPGRNGEGTVREVIEELIEDVDEDDST